MAYFTCLRCRELLTAGRASLFPVKDDADKTLDRVALGVSDARITNTATVEAKYRALRREADEWQKKRTVYMVARMQAGSHPDTDPAFWSGFKEIPPPSLDVDWRGEWLGNFANYVNRAFREGLVLVFFAALLGAASLKIAAARRRTRMQEAIQRATSRPE